jgi:hypothetical protein
MLLKDRVRSHFAKTERANASWIYARLMADRRTNGLVEVFQCSSCKQPSLDVCGWNGRHLPLCGACADGDWR